MSSDPSDFSQLDTLVGDLELVPQSGARGGGADSSVLEIVNVGGVLQVRDGAPSSGRSGGQARGQPRGPGEDVRWRSEMASLEPAKIGEWLEALDHKLTPHWGLRRWDGESLVPVDAPPAEGRVLLFVHGTFSNGESFVQGIGNNPDQADFRTWLSDGYDAVLSFDHPTLSRSPMLNAFELGQLFRESTAEVDVVAHSRGGLVTRWWLEAYDRAPLHHRRAVFVGSPLAGTGLAAPPNIRATMNLLANIGGALGKATAAVPFFGVLTGLFRIVSTMARLGSKTPAVDAMVALVPGLIAQSRVGNNRELQSLRRAPPPLEGRYFAVKSNFESDSPGWRFWKNFRKARVADVTTDAVFDGDNDLVVDTGSMIEVGELPNGGDGGDARSVTIPSHQVFDFKSGDEVHHTNYFEQPATLEFLTRALRRPVA